ncbi:TRAPPC10_2 [Blepharisma stoltei]|uniref:TRAPPC10/Trs130 N-terminal domain-containing protein n=1 Tax=Blepharisma stoltei TaxID=1481888 RepID=A0AAU9J6G7_9CILI|nr:unnamed protein product [Blepharisma stoltei]
MEIQTLQVAYHDEANIWSSIEGNLKSFLPLANISCLVNQVDQPLPPLNLKFVPSKEIIWETNIEDSFQKPYLWICIFVCDDIELFKSETKYKLGDLISFVISKQLEWLVLYVPTIEEIPKKKHRSYMKIYDNIQNFLFATFGVRQCVKLYNSTNKQFFWQEQLEDNTISYFSEFLISMSKSLGCSLNSRIKGYIENLDQPLDFTHLVLSKDGLALIYAMIGMFLESKACYDNILEFLDNFTKKSLPPISSESINNNEITTEDFRTHIKLSTADELIIRKYIFANQKRLLNRREYFVQLGESCVSYINTLIQVFSPFEEEYLKKCGELWIYKNSFAIAEQLYENIQSLSDEDYTKTSLKENIVDLLQISKSRLERLGIVIFGINGIIPSLEDFKSFLFDLSSHALENRKSSVEIFQDDEEEEEYPGKVSEITSKTKYQEILLEMTGKLYNCSTEKRLSNFYKVEHGILLTKKHRYEEGAKVLSSANLEEWTGLEYIALSHLFQCYLKSFKYSEGLETAIKMCKNSKYLSEREVTKIWKSIVQISQVSPQIVIQSMSIFKVNLVVNSHRLKQGDFLIATCSLYNYLSCDVNPNQIIAMFSYNENHQEMYLKAEQGTLYPGQNSFNLTGVVWFHGKLTSSVLLIDINNARFEVSMNNIIVQVEENTRSVTLIHKVPSLLVYDQEQLLAVEISTRQESIQDGVLDLQDSKILCSTNCADCISYSSDGKTSFKLPMKNCKIELRELPPQSRTFIILEIIAWRPRETSTSPKSRSSRLSIGSLGKSINGSIKSSVLSRLNTCSETHNFTAILRYSKNGQMREEISHSELSYVEPVRVTKNFYKREGKCFLQLIILNCARISLEILQWEFSGCRIEYDPNPQNQRLRTAQQLHMIFIITDIEKPVVYIQYCAVRKNDSRMHVDPIIDNKMRYQTFTMKKELLPEEVAIIRCSEPVFYGKPCLIYITIFTNKTVKVRIECSKYWEFPPECNGTFEGPIEDELAMEIIPRQAGTVELPEIVVWVNGKQVRVEGIFKVFIFPGSFIAAEKNV